MEGNLVKSIQSLMAALTDPRLPCESFYFTTNRFNCTSGHSATNVNLRFLIEKHLKFFSKNFTQSSLNSLFH